MGTNNDIQSNGWYADGDIVCTEEVYPIDLQDIFENTTEYSDIEEEDDDDADEDTECEESDGEFWLNFFLFFVYILCSNYRHWYNV